MADKFINFINHDFMHDDDFLKGWRNIRKKLGPDAESGTVEQRLLEAKLFYFSRFFESLSLDEYNIWLNSQRTTDLNLLTQDKQENASPLNYHDEHAVDSSDSELSKTQNKSAKNEEDSTEECEGNVTQSPSLSDPTPAPTSSRSMPTGQTIRAARSYPDCHQMENAINENTENACVVARNQQQHHHQVSVSSPDSQQEPQQTLPALHCGVVDSSLASVGSSPSEHPAATTAASTTVDTNSLDMSPSNPSLLDKCHSETVKKAYVPTFSERNNEWSKFDVSENNNNEDMADENLKGALAAPSGENCGNEPQYPSSFWQVMQCVERGEPIPGLEQLNIEPTNAQLTASTISRVKKPWQI